jgi:hypothetical protein
VDGAVGLEGDALDVGSGTLGSELSDESVEVHVMARIRAASKSDLTVLNWHWVR